ncbi:photosystem II biogenesis protein Psp29 [Chlorogloea sp. CCALA 695]|uniref:photosystem II biogenesis protein Psp29 n=1 Tax=Chlorogloea sp. CCALA 695 TaxID=2107693 RepID=UPI000D0569D5|nr:photosystem II biogenesis protein Psp29 [Chlorogloea sp. CCALA 695]PSB35518.1 photosystem II biogenesis protein Psp29 [Chlorogloea sp. CCALA 695]
MNTVRTVSDTKRSFYSTHTRPINTIYRRVVEELMVETHLLSVNADFSYNPIYALGFVTAYERFMQGYQPERDKESIFQALCQAINTDPDKHRQDAERLGNFAKGLSSQDLTAWLSGEKPVDGYSDLQEQIKEIANNPKFKYSRLFAIGVFSLLELSDPELVKDETKREEAFKQISSSLHLPEDKLNKDLDLYRGNVEKMNQALIVMEDMLAAERKKRQRKADEQQAALAAKSPDKPQDTAS